MWFYEAFQPKRASANAIQLTMVAICLQINFPCTRLGIPFLFPFIALANHLTHPLSEHSVLLFLPSPCEALFGLFFAVWQVFPNPFLPLSPA